MTQLIIFAILAYIFYKIYSGYKRFEKSYYKSSQFKNFILTKESLRKSELGLFVALCAKVAKVDGRIDELEAELISNMLNDISKVFPEPSHVKSLLKEIFDEEKNIRHNLDLVTQTLYEKLSTDGYKRQKMMEFLTNLAFIDGKLDTNEVQILTHIALLLRFKRDEYERMIDQFRNMYASHTPKITIDDAYKTLGVDASMNLDEIKKTYRKLVREYHPDIISAHGADEDYIKKATAKMQEINEAYELIKSKFA
jgi:DnaJ like chaperone protein